MRTYLVVVDETDEAKIALRFAARRAAKTGGAVELLALIPPAEPSAWAGVQATMDEEARQRAQALVAAASGVVVAEGGVAPSVVIEQGEPVAVVRALLEADAHVAALVLGAAASGAPGPLIAHFAGADAGKLPCPIMIVPGSLDESALDRLS